MARKKTQLQSDKTTERKKMESNLAKYMDIVIRSLSIEDFGKLTFASKDLTEHVSVKKILNNSINDKFFPKYLIPTAYSILSASIMKVGIQEPLIAYSHPTKKGYYILLGGHRRLESAIKANHKTVPIRCITNELSIEEEEYTILNLNLSSRIPNEYIEFVILHLKPELKEIIRLQLEENSNAGIHNTLYFEPKVLNMIGVNESTIRRGVKSIRDKERKKVQKQVLLTPPVDDGKLNEDKLNEYINVISGKDTRKRFISKRTSKANMKKYVSVLAAEIKHFKGIIDNT